MEFKKTCDDLYTSFLAGLQDLENGIADPLQQAEASLETCRRYLQQLKTVVSKYEFTGPGEEIHFFKKIKPRFASRLVFYKKVFLLHARCTALSEKARREYFAACLLQMEECFSNNQSFFTYYRSGCTHLDKQYFTRGQFDWRVCPDELHEDADPVFTTPCDHKVTDILANELLQEYIQEQQRCGLQQTSMPDSNLPAFTWTGTRAALGELIYAIHTCACINNGKVTVHEIARFFETQFNITLVNDIYKIYREMRMRKNNPVKFLDYLRDQLSKRIDMDDD